MQYRVIHDTEGNSPDRWVKDRDVTDVPCPSITCGIGGMNNSHFHVELRDTPPHMQTKANPPKPPYRVPPMAEVAALPWNGLKVASTFSGCGGSCTGYRMAGFKVVWANEFVPAAQDSYMANAAPGSILDPRDIKHVLPEEILAATGLKAGELDLFDGSPPCQAFSTAGKREKGWGKEKSYEHGARQCNETLFDQYVRLLRGLRPKVFVAENVSGLVKGTAKGYFIEILAALKASGYNVKAKLLDAQWLGVPQSRQRIIFVGVRDDLGVAPVFPSPLPYRYSVRDALPWILNIREDVDRSKPYHQGRRRGANGDEVCVTVKANGLGSSGSTATVETGTEKRKFTIAELKRICAFPDDFVLKGTYAQQWERLGNSVPPLMMRAVASEIRDKILLPLRAPAPGSRARPRRV